MALNFTFEYIQNWKNGNGFFRLGRKNRGDEKWRNRNQFQNCLSFMVKSEKGWMFELRFGSTWNRRCVVLLTKPNTKKKNFTFRNIPNEFPDWIWARKQIFFCHFLTLLHYFVCLRFGYAGLNFLFCGRHPWWVFSHFPFGIQIASLFFFHQI